jgi:peptidoglycan-associated lipoprotein
MKTMKLIYPLAFALAITLASTGCRSHQPVGITPIPGPAQTSINDQDNQSTLSNGVPVNPETGVNGNNVIPVANADEFEGMLEDTNALAADTIHFPYDSAAIRSSEQANLQAVASALSADSSAKLLIQGNCDERGTEEYNRSLGERRALAAREALAKLGVDPMRVRTISFGKDKPVDPGHDESAWQQNRRDEFVLLHPKASS